MAEDTEAHFSSNLQELDGILPTYINSREEDVIGMLYKPCLKRSIKYVRGAGYFRSSVFRLMSEDLLDFCIKGGKITLLTSTQWGREDYQTAIEAYSKDGIKEDLSALLNDPNTIEPTRMLCALIKNDKLDLRVAVLRGEIYHQKKGYFEDSEGNIVAFDGSGNETQSALKPFDEGNAESFNICWNWHQGLWSFYGMSWKKDLDNSLNEDYDSTFPVVRVSELDSEFIDKWDIDINLESHRKSAKARQKQLEEKWDSIWGKSTQKQKHEVSDTTDFDDKKIKLPDDLYKHQKRGREKWKNAGFKGILEYATGSGKTLTSLSLIKEHLNTKGHAIILLPSDALLHQWEEEFDTHLPEFTKGLLGGGHKDDSILDEMRIPSQQGIALLSTIQSFRADKIQRKIDRLLSLKGTDLLIVVDECHRIGAPSFEELCKKKFPYKLGLSATPTRQGDPEGSERIIQFLGKIVDSYTLLQALSDERLSAYDYHVNQVALTEKEQEEYDELRAKIRKAFAMKKRDEPPSEYLESLIFRSRRIIRGASNKVPKAIELISSSFEEGQHWLIYCENEAMMGQIESKLHTLCGLYPFRYWSGMDRFQRKMSLQSFEKSGGIMLAIKCLDEGVDVPAISHGIVLASSKTKREFIQRRGRMLRHSPGKNKAVIFDVLALPSNYGTEVSFVTDEVRRAVEFSEGASNKLEVEHYLTQIKIEFGISDEDIYIEMED